MKIFGSISELVDLAFRLTGGKQVKLKSRTQDTSAAATTTVYIPNVSATGDQDMVLVNVSQTLTNKTLTAPTINGGGTIDGVNIVASPIGQGGVGKPAAGTFTTLESNSTTQLEGTGLKIKNIGAGILHVDGSNAVTSSKIVNSDLSDSANIGLDKLAQIGAGNIIVGNTGGAPTAVSVSGDVTINNAGVTAITAGAITNTDVNFNAAIERSKLATGVNNTFVTNNSTGVMQSTSVAGDKAVVTNTSGLPAASTTSAEQIALLDNLNPIKGKVQDQLDNKQATITGSASSIARADSSPSGLLTANRALITDGSQLVQVSATTATELGYVSGVTSAIQTQINNKAAKGANSDITSLSGLTTALSTAQGGTGISSTATFPSSGTVATTANKLSAFAATSSSELAGVISDETGSGSLVFNNTPTIATPAITGGTINSMTANRFRADFVDLAIATGALAATKGFIRLTAGESTLNTINDPNGILAFSGVSLTIVNYSVGADVTITNAGNITTGTGSNFTLAQNAAVSLVHNGNGKYVLTGGAGAGGGLTTSALATTLSPAVKNTHYLTNTSGGAFSVTLPAGAAGSVIRFSDANETWDANALTIIPASGEKLDNLATNESLVCDVKRGWVELSWNTALSSWSFQSLSATNVVAASTTQAGVVKLKAPTQTKLTSGSGTYTVPAGVFYLKVKMVGGGGGGAGSGTAGNGVGGAGGTTTFGSSLLTCTGGAGAGLGGSSVAGGSATIGAGAFGVAFSGQGGHVVRYTSGGLESGGAGGSTPFGGGGAAQSYGANANPGITNTGSGGGGGGGNSSGTVYGQGGGGAGGYIDAIITTLASTYSYAVGSGGNAGVAGTSGFPGGAGGSGIIVIDEYYY